MSPHAQIGSRYAQLTLRWMIIPNLSIRHHASKYQLHLTLKLSPLYAHTLIKHNRIIQKLVSPWCKVTIFSCRSLKKKCIVQTEYFTTAKIRCSFRPSQQLPWGLYGPHDRKIHPQRAWENTQTSFLVGGRLQHFWQSWLGDA